MFFIMNKKKNLLFLEKTVRNKFVKLIEELIKRRERTLGQLEDENYLPFEIKLALKESGLTYQDFDTLCFEVFNGSVENFHRDNSVMIDSKIKTFRVDDYYFRIVEDTIGTQKNLYLKICSYPPKYYTAIIELDESMVVGND